MDVMLWARNSPHPPSTMGRIWLAAASGDHCDHQPSQLNSLGQHMRGIHNLRELELTDRRQANKRKGQTEMCERKACGQANAQARDIRPGKLGRTGWGGDARGRRIRRRAGGISFSTGWLWLVFYQRFPYRNALLFTDEGHCIKCATGFV